MSDLRFRSDSSFTIVQFTDLHWHNGEPADYATRAVMETAPHPSHPRTSRGGSSSSVRHPSPG